MSNILFVGATGFVGGTLLTQLLSSQHPTLKPLTFTLLARSSTSAAKLLSYYGSRINVILWPDGLSNPSFIADTAASYDIVINAGTGLVSVGIIAFVEGLARRVEEGGHAVPWMLNISGCTSLSDRPITQESLPDRTWSDADEATRVANFNLLRGIDAKDPYS